jgi:conjugal transfer/entry exclusion protein
MTINETIDGAVVTMQQARDQIRDAMRVEQELSARIEQQRALMKVALGYIQSGRPELAALVLDGQEAEI